mgnify:CR=1 FL=1
MLELLNQLDGFDNRGDIKVIMATNLIESLDPALIRPGRISLTTAAMRSSGIASPNTVCDGISKLNAARDTNL